MTFTEINRFVNNYIEHELKQGRTLNEIIESFREVPLPYDLKASNYPTDELRRHGQLIVTRHILQDAEARSSKTSFI